MKEQFLNLSGLIDLVTYIKLCIAQHKVIIPRASFSLFPETGDENNIYIDTSTNAIYRWNDTDKKFVLLAKPPRTIAISEGTNNGEITLKVDNIASNAKVHGLTSTAFTELNKFATAVQGAKADSAVQTITLSSGTKNGTIKIKVNNITTDNIEVAGLGSAAFSDIGIFATKSHTHIKSEVGLGSVDNTADKDKSVKFASSAGSVDWENVQNKPTSYTPTSHSHDDKYYTKGQVDSKLGGKSDTGHTHSQFTQETKFSNDTFTDPLPNTSVAIKASGGIATDLIYEGGSTLSSKYQPKGNYAANSHTHDDRYYTESEIDSKLSGKANSSHTHTKDQVGLGNVDNTSDSAKNVNYANSAGTASSVADSGEATADIARHVWFSNTDPESKRVYSEKFKYNPATNVLTVGSITGSASSAASVQWSGVQNKPTSYTPSAHTHDDRYYTESEINSKLSGKANSSHSHGNGDITSLDASKLTGTINIDRLPAGALERCVIVDTESDRLKLTTATVQKGDTVKVVGSDKMYFVIDDTKLSSEAGYTVYTAGSATSVPWSGITGIPSTFTPSSHTHSKSQITDFPSSLPASDVYAWAKASSKPSYSKSEVGLGNVDNTADSAKSVKYATSAGSAGSSTKATQDSEGQQINSTYIKSLAVNGRTITYTKGDNTTGTITTQDTNTVYTHPSYSAKTSGLYKITVDGTGHVSGVTSVTKADITGLGIPGQDTNTDTKVTQSAVKSSDYTNWRTIIWGSSNSTTEGFTPTSVTDGVFSDPNLTYQPSTGTLRAITFKGNLSGNATSASSVAWGNVTGKPSTFTPSSHSHNYAGSSSAGGSANSAAKLDTATAGSATQPVYFSGGKPTACSYTLGKSVPSNAVFTDTNTWRPLGTTADTACAGNDSRLSNARPASDVYSWAKASTKPSYSKSEVGLGNVDNTADKNKSVNYANSAGTASRVPDSGEGTGNMARHVWFSNTNPETSRVYSDKFQYNPATDVLTVGSITGSASSAASVPWSGVTGKPSVPESGDFSANTLEDLLKSVQGKSPRMGSTNLGKDTRVANSWYNFIYIPHRNGIGGDNMDYGTLLLFPMTFNGESAIIQAGKDGAVKSIYTLYSSRNISEASVKYATSAGSVAWKNVSGRPSSLPASDVYAWAKASTKPSYSWSEITNKPSTFTPSSHTHSYLPLSGGTLSSGLYFSGKGSGNGIYAGPNDAVNGPGGAFNNLVISSWFGVSFTTSCNNTTYYGKTAVGINCRDGIVKAAKFEGALSGNATSASSVPWSGVTGKPSSLPASDVYSWAKASTKPSYSYTEITNRPTLIKAVSKNGYWGMADHDGSDSNWIRTTTSGIIPYQSGGAGAGHCGIGTSSWYFSNAYIDTVNCVNASVSGHIDVGGYIQSSNLINTYFEYQSNRGSVDWRFGAATGTSDENFFGFYDAKTGKIPLALDGNFGNIYVGFNVGSYESPTAVGVYLGGQVAGNRAFIYNGDAYQGSIWIQTRLDGSWKWFSLGRVCSTALSDIRLKGNIRDTEVEDATKVIESMKIRSFERKDSHKKYKIGFIADELEQLDPNLVDGGGEVDGHPYYKSVNNLQMLAYVVKGMQELNSKVTILEQENKRLKQKLNMCN